MVRLVLQWAVCALGVLIAAFLIPGIAYDAGSDLILGQRHSVTILDTPVPSVAGLILPGHGGSKSAASASLRTSISVSTPLPEVLSMPWRSP